MVKKWEEEREEIIQESEQQKKNQKHDREAGLKGFDPNKRVKKRVNDDDLGGKQSRWGTPSLSLSLSFYLFPSMLISTSHPHLLVCPIL